MEHYETDVPNICSVQLDLQLTFSGGVAQAILNVFWLKFRLLKWSQTNASFNQEATPHSLKQNRFNYI